MATDHAAETVVVAAPMKRVLTTTAMSGTNRMGS